jgi:hypothetical protein
MTKYLLFLATCLWAFSLPAKTLAVPEVEEKNYTEALSHWQTVLSQYVNIRGQVDFYSLRNKPRDLHIFVNYIAREAPFSHPDKFPELKQKLTYYINAYNALAMYAVIESGIPESLTGFHKMIFFYWNKIIIGGKSLSLYALENDYIRPLNEPRIHFALNCMSVGCPRLPQHIFAANQLDRQLENQSRFFFSETRNYYRNDQNRIVYVSEIMDFYTNDFVLDDNSLVGFLNNYVDRPIPDNYYFRFIDFDWTINTQRLSNARTTD